jgi:hypothetical protein
MPAFGQPFCASVQEIVWNLPTSLPDSAARGDREGAFGRNELRAGGNAAQTGFTDQAALTRTFANVVGATPGKWRREHSHRRMFVEIREQPSSP